MEKISAFYAYQQKKRKDKKKNKIQPLGSTQQGKINRASKKTNKLKKQPQLKKGMLDDMASSNLISIKNRTSFTAEDSDSSEAPMLVEFPESKKDAVTDENQLKSNGCDSKNKRKQNKSTVEKIKKPILDLMKKTKKQPTVEEQNTTVTSEEKDEEDDQNHMVGQEIFKWIIDPIPIPTFFKKYWEKKPQHISRKTPKYFEALFPTNYLDEMIRKNNLLFGTNLDVVTYQNGTRETLNPHDGRATTGFIWDCYSNGSSIRIKNPQTYCTRLQVALTELQEFFGTYVGVNLYLTPPGSQGFAPHWDDIEAFVVQLEGRKHWKLYQPKNKKDILARFSSPNLKLDELGEHITDVTVEAGDTLYFPRGIIHQAKTDDNTHSLHLTISVYQKTSYTDLLESYLPLALQAVSERDDEFRKGLPLGYLKYLGEVNTNKSASVRLLVMQNIKKLLDKLFDDSSVDSAVDLLGKRLMQESLPHIPNSSEKQYSFVGAGDILDHGVVRDRVEIGVETKIRLLRYFCARLVEEMGATNLYYTTQNSLQYSEDNGKVLNLEEHQIPAVKILINEYPNYVKIENLPGDDEQNIDLVRDLWETGLLLAKNFYYVGDEEN